MIFKAAVVQTNAGPEIGQNLTAVGEIIRAAANDGATLIATPENTCRMRAKPEDKWASSYDEAAHPAISYFSSLSKELKITLIVGSLSSVRAGEHKLANRSYVFGKDGATIATYDKIHTFDVDLPNGDKYRESDTCLGGDRIVTAETDQGKIGLSVCYDLRFPNQYRHMATEGAQILSIPAAFTVPTGEAHWEVLLRARAIENGAFVLAPAQVGVHEGGRSTWGHSMIVGPWGEILAEIKGQKPGYTIADINLAAVDEARFAIPSLLHDRVISGAHI